MVDPDVIERSSTHHQGFFTYLVPHTYKTANKSGTHIVDGCWDDQEWLEANTTDENGGEPLWAIEEDYRFVTAQQLLREGRPEEETAAFSKLADTKASELCSKINTIADSIRNLGYRSQSELKEAHPEYYHTPFYLPESYDEILVAIGRDGEILLVTNITRLIVAKLLDVDQVPVRVVVRHQEWQAKRSAHSSGGVSGWPDCDSHLRSHPDVQKNLR